MHVCMFITIIHIHHAICIGYILSMCYDIDNINYSIIIMISIIIIIISGYECGSIRDVSYYRVRTEY